MSSLGLRSLALGVRRASTQAKPYYITTPIFYVNANPHIGHAYSMLLCDVKTRWEKLSGRPTYFTTGTDEHGLKVQNAAEASKTSPKTFCDATAANFKALASLIDIDYDRFIRTTDQDHYKAVKHFWNLLVGKGYIYKGKHCGWYSISDETFYPEQQIESKVVDGQEKFYSIETGSEVVFEWEENYFFKLKELRPKLIEYLQQNESFIYPEKYHKDILKELVCSEGADLSVSRPSSRLHWGIPVPDDDSQVIYVWVDALVNYLTSAGYPWVGSGIETPVQSPWPATHLIGKDITRFHCIYWPSLLMAAGVELPEKVVVHGHWLMGGTKMSKSKGNVADPVIISEYYGSDILRFFLCENSILTGDCDFTEAKLNQSRNQFIDKLCNLILRCCGKKFNPERALTKYETVFKNSNFLSALGEEKHVTEVKELLNDLDSLHANMDGDLENFTTHRAISRIWNALFQVNQIFQDGTPWFFKPDASKENTLNDPLNKQDFYIFAALETSRITCILLQPFIPKLAAQLLDTLNVDQLRRNTNYAKVGADLEYARGITRNKNSEVPLTKVELRKDAYC